MALSYSFIVSAVYSRVVLKFFLHGFGLLESSLELSKFKHVAILYPRLLPYHFFYDLSKCDVITIRRVSSVVMIESPTLLIRISLPYIR